MTKFLRAATRLVFSLFLLACLGSGARAIAIESSPLSNSALNSQQPTANTQNLTADPHIVQPPPWMDRDGDRVDDRLEQKYRQQHQAGLQPRQGPAVADLMLCLDHAPTASDLARYREMGATQVQGWGDLVYVVRARFPAAGLSAEALEQLGQQPGVVWVEENLVLHPCGFFVTRQTRARAAWATGFEGNPGESIAILDTGIDGTHPDLAGRVAGWVDFAGADASNPGSVSQSPIDRDGHGTANAGLAAGSGAAAGISQGVGPLNLSFAPPLASSLQNGMRFPVDTTAGGSPITARLKWQGASGSVSREVDLLWDPAHGGGLLGSSSASGTASQPFSFSTGAVLPGIFSFLFQAAVVTKGTSAPAWLQISTPMSAAGDGRPLMRGVAPGCRIVGVKVFDDNENSTVGILLNAATWVTNNRRALNVVCANASLSADAPSALLDGAVDQVVQNGVVWVSGSGNSSGSGVFSPASASHAIAVGATNERDQVTNYSSYGSGQRKPDLVAPGGSNATRRALVVLDTNSADPSGSGGWVASQFPNDYAVYAVGTSFASPQVAGAAMLVAQAMGSWNFTEAQALSVKMILLMTASETGQAAEQSPSPAPNRRGAKDTVEGFGRLNVDAAVEAVSQSFSPGSQATVTLGASVLEKKVWARSVTLTAGTAYSFTLINPGGTAGDLFLYSDTPTTVGSSAGEPQIVASGTPPSPGGTETIQFTPTSTGRYYLVGKYLSGAGGAFRITSR